MNPFNENKAVGRLTELLALEHGYTPAKARMLRNAAVLHDIGKQKLPAELLSKPGKLDAHEFEIMKTHTKLGVEMLSSIQGELGEAAKMIALFHHEWQDPELGGYWGISAHYLPEYVPFVSISDVFTALLSERPYKGAFPPEDALALIQGQAGTQFTAVLVEIFTHLIQHDSRVPVIFTDTGT